MYRFLPEKTFKQLRRMTKMAETKTLTSKKVSKAATKTLISKKALIKSWFIWETFPQTCYNYERMMGQVVAHMFVPIIYLLYANNPEKRKEVMKREIEFFNVHIEFGACILGMVVALEEQKALGEDIPAEFITNIKTSLMGPLAGIGDTIWQGVVIPILLAICIDITRTGNGNVWGSIIYAIVIIAGAYALSYWNFMFGYYAGSEAIMDFLEKGTLNKILKGASIMGCMVMGGLIVNYVKVKTGIEIATSTSTFKLQTDFFDKVMPSILPLGVTMMTYGLLKKRWSSIKVIVLFVVIGIVAGLTGILSF
jgi:mannose/fructose/N-acetylgalactosamine-specific phosphotransferase system component IID